MTKVENLLQSLDKIINDDREKTLILLGLTEKEYSPDGKENWQYKKREIINGECKYYKDVAIKVTDDEYELIISKVKQAEKIKEKEELERQKESTKKKNTTIKKLIPIYQTPKSWFNDEEEDSSDKSLISLLIRIVHYTLVCIALIVSIIISDEINIIPYALFVSVSGSLFIELLIAILQQLTELNAIAKQGYQFTETKK